MASLDVSDAFDDELLSTFEVVRRPEHLVKGRSIVEPERICNVQGVVTMASPNVLERFPEFQEMGNFISVITEFGLRGPSKTRTAQNYQPDLIFWEGGYYVVRALDSYRQYGDGFVEAICGSTEYVDNATASPVLPQ